MSEGDPASAAARAGVDAEMLAYYRARAPEYDDWYERRGRYARGPAADAAWAAELGAARAWLAGLPLAGDIVELAAGTGWWSPVLATMGRLSLYDGAAEPLARARERLRTAGGVAEIGVRDAWAEPDRQADGLFTGFWLSHVSPTRFGEFLALAAAWLRPGGIYAFVDSLPDPDSGVQPRPRRNGELEVRALADGREFTIVKVHRTPEEYAAALAAAGFREVSVSSTGRFFALGVARR